MSGTNGSIHILFVDDEPDLADVAARFLEQENEGFDVETAANATEGLERLDEQLFDCVISDFEMPGPNGIEFLQAVRDTKPDLPFILYTGRGSEEIASEAISAGGTEYLQKSAGVGQYAVLANRIENAVEACRAARELRRTKTLLDHTEDLANVGGWELDVSRGPPYPGIQTEGLYRIHELPTEEELPLSRGLEYIHPDDREQVIQLVDRLINQGQPFEVEGRIITENENVRWVRTIGAPVIENGRVIKYRGAMVDITELKRREQQLEMTRDRLASHNAALRRFNETSAMRETSLDQKLQEILELGCEYLETAVGYIASVDEQKEWWEIVAMAGTDEQLEVGTNVPYSETYCPHVVAADGVFEFVDADQSEMAGEKAYDRWGFETYLGAEIRTDGTSYGAVGFVDREGRELPFDEGHRNFVALASRWMSAEIERRERERALQRYREFTDAMLNAIEDVFYLVNEDRTLDQWNERLTEVTEYSDADVQEMRAEDFFVERDQSAVADAIDEAFVTGRGDVRARILTKSESRIPYEFIACRVFDPDGRPKLAGIGREMSRQEERLEEFASAISHDLRNPLNTAVSNLMLVRDECESDRLDAVERSHERIRALIDDVVTLAREGQKVTDLEEVRLASLVDTIAQDMEMGEASLVVASDRVVRADRNRLTRVLENLIRNAVEHGDRDVTIEVGELPDGFYVEDDGPGIPEEDRKRVFELGYSTTSTGTGYGLRIVRDLVDAHGWDIRATEGSEGGARFEITGVSGNTSS